MQELPVLETWRHVYRFFFGNFRSIVAVASIPIAIIVAASYAYSRWQIEQELSSSSQPMGLNAFAFLGRSSAQLLLGNVIEALLVGVAAIGVHRLVLFQERAPRLGAGPVETRFLALAAITAAASVISTLVMVYAIAPGSFQFGPAIALLIFVVQIAILVLTIRLSPVFPVIVAEGRVSLARAWQITRGNFWRIFGLNFLIWLPLICVAMIVQFLLLPGPPYGGVLSPVSRVELLNWQRDNLLLFEVVGGLFYLVFVPIGVIVLSYTYKLLAGHDFDEALQPPEARSQHPPA